MRSVVTGTPSKNSWTGTARNQKPTLQARPSPGRGTAAGASDHVDELGGAPDLNYLQVISRDGKIGYSRSLKAISPNSLRTRFSKSTVPKIIDHHGIEDTMIEKGLTIWYWFRASWMRIGGSE
jgi:hypothetical protein